MDETSRNLIIGGIFMLLITGMAVYGTYMHKKMKFENFQETIKDLNDEQKCMHICGFQYPSISYFDQYKFCLEKCDRISERTLKVCQNSVEV